MTFFRVRVANFAATTDFDKSKEETVLVIPVCFNSRITVRQLSEEVLTQRAKDWALVLHEAGLTKPDADVIYTQPIVIPAGSIFGWVDFAIWSKSNPDFTFLSQFNLFVKRRKKYVLARIGQMHHPELLTEKYAYNLWLIKLDGGNFAAGSVGLFSQILELVAQRKLFPGYEVTAIRQFEEKFGIHPSATDAQVKINSVMRHGISVMHWGFASRGTKQIYDEYIAVIQNVAQAGFHLEWQEKPSAWVPPGG